ncbi:MAG: hypothetical protein HN921_09955 [Bacteroidetes bacterium]|jgi:hypothetical protein|nr:hypothetical protein [Bacteroidota bacterium]MBT5527800.1 hypothetical protein [Cytophagia bacterium]MBT6835284.1 hypothetical protein [Bacteroidota bacterium]MBT7040154.1 hypothetical protein [Bacteroidota bacterium]
MMFIKQLVLFIILIGLAVFLLNIKAVFKKKGKLEKSCTAKHRLMHEKGLDCEGCNKGPMQCSIDDNEHKLHHQHVTH